MHNDAGFNLLQKSVGINHIELARWLLQRHRLDVNRSPCSLPLHIACLKGYEECVELLLKHGARIDTEARMCFPGKHSHNCEESGKYANRGATYDDNGVRVCEPVIERHNTKLQNAICYAIDGDHIQVVNILTQKKEEPWVPFRVKKPLLHLACEKGAWRCVQHLVTRSEEINMIKDEYIDEFSPGNQSSDDDEETIAKEEAEDATDTKDEIAALQKESEMDLDDLDFLADYLKNRDNIVLSEDEDMESEQSKTAKKPDSTKDSEESNVSLDSF